MPDDQIMHIIKLVAQLESNPYRSALISEIFQDRTKFLLAKKADKQLQVRRVILSR